MKAKLLNKLERDMRALQRNVASSAQEVRQNIAYAETSQTPFIRERLNTSFEVGYTTARNKLDDKCMEIYQIPGYTPDEQQRFMDIMDARGIRRI